jgi:hypothetical protein
MDQQPTPPISTLSAAAAHSTVIAMANMYSGVIADYERQLQMMQAMVRATKAGEQAADQKIKELEGIMREGRTANSALVDRLNARAPAGIPDALASRLMALLPAGETGVLICSDEELVERLEALVRPRVGHGG